MRKVPVAAAVGFTALIVVVFVVVALAMSRRPSLSLFGDKVGVVAVSGVISNPVPTLKALDKFRRDDSIKAVLLRVESPGGAVAASQEIYQEVLRVKACKPIVCSMGNVAASGGYYIAAPCSKIVASRGTVTGSIGVIMTLANLRGLFDKVGLQLQIVQSGKLKATGTPARALSEQERARLQGVISQTHEQFIADVAAGRGLKVDKVRALADGGVMTGQQAKKLGLVDQFGNLHDAIMLAAKLGGIKGRPELVLPDEDSEGWLGRMLRDQVRAVLSSLADDLVNFSLEYRYLAPQGSD